VAVCALIPAIAGAQDADPRCARCDTSFIGSFYTGVLIDSFAAEELRRYLNPDESSKVVERVIAGFDFQYRLMGDPADTHPALWVYGETLHGIRSADVDCADDTNLAVCQPFQDILNRAGERTLFILRKATSLEAFAGVRYEFLDLQRAGREAARLYLKAQAGFLTVSGSGHDVVDVHHVALGAGAVRGNFQGSYLEVGLGRTDLFETKPRGRLKVDGFLTWPVRWLDKIGQPFVQMTVDSDLGDGADSIQSFIGFDFNLTRLWKTPRGDE
jgi:hypothetical protein